MFEAEHYLLGFYVPESHLEKVLEAVFKVGVGKFKAYDRCAWTTSGKGRFRPLNNSIPFIGKQGEDSFADEIKVECIVAAGHISAVKKALCDAHPYEEPAYHFIPFRI
jgi:hypothetical protein